jgi:hypothetical protein
MCALQSNEFGMDLDAITQRYNSAVSSFHEWHQGVVIISQISCVHRVVPRWRLDMFLAISGVVGLLCCDPMQDCHMQCCKSVLVARCKLSPRWDIISKGIVCNLSALLIFLFMVQKLVWCSGCHSGRVGPSLSGMPATSCKTCSNILVRT